MPNYLVFGAGRQGTASIYDLIKYAEAEIVRVIEPHDSQRTIAQTRLESLLGKDAKKIQFIDNDSANLKDTDAALSAAPYHANAEITRRCVELNVPLCDLGGNPDVVAKQEAIAAGKKVPVVPDCGVSPGITNIAIAHLAREYGVTHVKARCGGLAVPPPKNELKYLLVFSPNGLISEYSGECAALHNGEVVMRNALENVQTWTPGRDNFDESNTHVSHADTDTAVEPRRYESFNTSNNSPQITEFFRELGILDYDYQTIRYAGHVAKARAWRELGFLVGNPDADQRLADQLAQSESLRFNAEEHRDRLILDIDARAGARRYGYQLDVRTDEVTGFTAMELTTSWGGAIVAHHLATRTKPKSFATPEQFVDTRWFLDQIDTRLADVTPV
jgi:lysine 6-dehydrogenase